MHEQCAAVSNRTAEEDRSPKEQSSNSQFKGNSSQRDRFDAAPPTATQVNMHEIGIMTSVCEVILKTMEAHKVTKVETVVLQVGELTGIVPSYLSDCYAFACHKTAIEGSRLEVEVVPGLARCKMCKKVFNLMGSDGRCSECKSESFDILSGKELVIKQIVAR
jgi:hydrogenase nickel incorporation protein HypA/HybF